MKLKQRLSLCWIAVLIIIIDRIAKALIVQTDSVIVLIRGVVSLSCQRNSGVAFSMLSGSTLPIILLTAALIIGILVYLCLGRNIGALCSAGMWMMVGGGIGNLYDRIAFGYVIDYIRTDFVRFAVFNAADIFVCVGCGLTVIGLLADEYKERKNSAV